MVLKFCVSVVFCVSVESVAVGVFGQDFNAARISPNFHLE